MGKVIEVGNRNAEGGKVVEVGMGSNDEKAANFGICCCICFLFFRGMCRCFIYN